MIYNAIIGRLKADNELSVLLGATEENSKIYPLSADISDAPCIVYTDSPISDDGRIKINRFEIRIIDAGYPHMESIDAAVSRLLIIPEDSPGYIVGGVNVMATAQNGGGTLSGLQTGSTEYNSDLYERFLYFDITWRDV